MRNHVSEDRFVDPHTKQRLYRSDDGDLFFEHGKKRVVYKNHNGIFDFTQSSAEKDHYQEQYRVSGGETVDVAAIHKKWHDEKSPENQLLLESLGDLQNKQVLLLGNGLSTKELYFLELGAKIVYTDLSINAVTLMRRRVSASELNGENSKNIEFHAINALHLPFPNESFDVIYGFNFVHHIADLDQLFSEVYRCLVNGGICRFLDGAYSPIWQFSKATFLRPLQLYSYKRKSLSPEDMRASKKGGYRQKELINLMDKFGFTDHLYERMSFFRPLFVRGVGKILGYDNFLIKEKSQYVIFMKRLDDYLAKKSKMMQNNMILLVWGFTR